MPLSTQDHYHIEVIRKAIHLCSLSIPIVYYFTSKQTALTLLLPLTIAFVAIDLLRYYHQPTRAWFYTTFGWLLRQHETDEKEKRFNGATFVLLSAVISILIFPKVIVITSFSILIISDIAAALIGKRFGKRKFYGKSLEGSLAFFISGLLVVAFTPKINHLVEEYFIGFISVVVGTIVEALPLKIDDNLSIPLSVGLALWALYHFILPTIDLSALR
jgi:dolichol kinase